MQTKEFHFPASARWVAGRRVVATVPGKPPLPVAAPPEFRGTDPSTWSPEDLLVAAAASCLGVTLAGLALRAGLPLHALDVSGTGTVGARDDGSFGFTRIELRVELETDAPDVERARELVATAERTCLVAVSLDVPVETVAAIAAAVPAAA